VGAHRPGIGRTSAIRPRRGGHLEGTALVWRRRLGLQVLVAARAERSWPAWKSGVGQRARRFLQFLAEFGAVGWRCCWGALAVLARDACDSAVAGKLPVGRVRRRPGADRPVQCHRHSVPLSGDSLRVDGIARGVAPLCLAGGA
jgi:hypothetical protein